MIEKLVAATDGILFTFFAWLYGFIESETVFNVFIVVLMVLWAIFWIVRAAIRWPVGISELILEKLAQNGVNIVEQLIWRGKYLYFVNGKLHNTQYNYHIYGKFRNTSEIGKCVRMDFSFYNGRGEKFESDFHIVSLLPGEVGLVEVSRRLADAPESIKVTAVNIDPVE